MQRGLIGNNEVFGGNMKRGLMGLELVRNSRRGKSLPLPFNPLLYDTQFWYDANNGLSIDNLNEVDGWLDLSGNGRNLTRFGGGNMSISTTGEFKDTRPACLWTGDHYLQASVGSVTFNEIFLVLHTTETGSSWSGYRGILSGSLSGEAEIVLLGDPGSTSFYSSATAPFPNDFRLNNVMFQVDSNIFEALKEPTILYGKYNTGKTINNIVFGRDRDNANRNWLGYMGEMIATNKSGGLSSQEYDDIYNYLSNKWINNG